MNLSDEVWLAARLKQHGAQIFDGLTTPKQRCERMRQAILAAGLADRVLGKSSGQHQTYRVVFERLYGQPLEAS